MHDVQLEEQLRRALLAEADSLPFTLTSDTLEIRLAARRRTTFNHRLTLVMAAGLAVIAVGVGAYLLNRETNETVPVSPSPTASAPAPSAGPSESPSASEAASPEPSPAASPTPGTRPTGALGEPDDAVMVTFVGDPINPDRIDVSLMRVDAGAFETQFEQRPLVSLPGIESVAPGYRVEATPPKYSPDGWLAISVTESTAGLHSIVLYDLRSGSPVQRVQGNLATAAWNGGSVLAIGGQSTLRLFDAATRTESAIEFGDNIRLIEGGGGELTSEPPQWTADGTGILTRSGADDDFSGNPGVTTTLDGSFHQTDLVPELLQTTGVERHWGADWTSLGGGCPTEGGPPGCVIETTASAGGVTNAGDTTTWYQEDDGLGRILNAEWDASGYGLWLTVDRAPEAAPTREIAVMHASQPSTWRDVVTFPMELSVNDYPGLAGLRDAGPTEDGQLFLFGVPFGAGPLQLAAAGHGVHQTFDGSSWFAGWAGEQTPYPGLIGP